MRGDDAIPDRTQSAAGDPRTPCGRSTSITAFFPAYNDVRTIASLVDRVDPILREVAEDYEIVVIDDGSTDGTGALLDALARRRPNLRVIHHHVNRGYGAALRSGFREATKELVFYTDGDGQYDVAELRDLLPLMRPGVDVVNGYKIARADRWHRVLLGTVYNRVASVAFRLPIRDVDCDFRLIRTRAVRSIDLKCSSGAICVELVHKLHVAGAGFTEAPVRHYRRPHGRSQFFAPSRVLHTAFDLAVLWAAVVVSRWGSGFGSRKTVKETRV